MIEHPKVLYYRARDELYINDLPIFFGWVELKNEIAVGSHYRARIEKMNKKYLIGYYWLELEADVFFQKFEEHGDVEITREEFEDLLDRWTQHGKYPPFCWNPEQSPERSRHQG
jgi:hypothetical protein